MHRIQSFTILLLLLTSVPLLQSQTWSKHLPFWDGAVYGILIKKVDDGFLLNTGPICNNDDCAGVIKTDPDGNILWKFAALDSISENHEECMAVLNDTIYLNTNYYGPASLTKDYSLLMVDMNGNYLGRRDFLFPSDYHSARDLAVNPDLYFLNFRSRDLVTHRYRQTVQTYDHQWNLKWGLDLPRNQIDAGGCDLEATQDGGIAVAYTGDNNILHYMLTVDKYDRFGHLQWGTVLQHSYEQSPFVTFAQHKDGGYIGSWEIDTFGIYLYPSPTLIFKLDSTGALQWEKITTTQLQRNVFQIFSANNGDIIVTGFDNTSYVNTPLGSGYVKRMNPLGETKWERRLRDTREGATSFNIFDGVEMDNGDFVMTGQWFKKPNDMEVWLIRVDSNGCFSPNCADINQFLVSTQIPVDPPNASLFSAFPSPFSSHLSLGAILGAHIPSGAYTAVLYDFQGRPVLDQSFNPMFIKDFDTTQLPKGVYVLGVFKDGQLVEQKKLVKN